MMTSGFVLAKAKARGLKSVGCMVTCDTTPEIFDESIASGIGQEIGRFRLVVNIGGTSCSQSSSYIVESCKEALQEQNLSILESRFPGCLVTEKANIKALVFHVEAVPDQKARSEASKAVYHGNQGKRDKALHQACLLQTPSFWRPFIIIST